MFTSSNHVEKKADNSTSIENINSLQCLSEWIKNIESNEPDLIQLDFAKIKDDLVKNVKGNDTAMKLCYSKMWTYNDQDEQTKINKAYWNGYNSIIHFILDEEKSLLYPVSNPEIHKKQSKIQKLLQSNKSLSIICEQSILILKLLLLDTKIIKICELYEDGDTTEWSIYYHIVNLLHCMYCNEAYYQKYGITNIMELYFNFFVQCWTEKGDYEKYQDSIINIQEHPREQRISYSTICNPGLGVHSFLPIKLIKKLLWKNISPVQFCEGCNWGFDDVITCYDVEQIKNDHQLSTKFENICRKIVDNKLKTNLAVTAPLIIMIYLNEIKVEMEGILNECLLELDLMSIIIEYLYFDIGSIYKIKNFENEFSVKCYHFLNYLDIINADLIFNNNFDNTPFEDMKIGKISEFLFKYHEKEIMYAYWTPDLLKRLCCLVGSYKKKLKKENALILIYNLVQYKDFNGMKYCLEKLYIHGNLQLNDNHSKNHMEDGMKFIDKYLEEIDKYLEEIEQIADSILQNVMKYTD